MSVNPVFEMDQINPEFSAADAVLVEGTNDVANPATKTDKTSPVCDIPILDAHKARQVFAIKRSMNSGYSGVENLLFYQDNRARIFGDAKNMRENGG